MHQYFADWYQPVTFDHDRSTYELRLQGLETIVKKIDFEFALELIRFVFDRPLQSDESTITLRNNFKEYDPTFQMEGNDLEVKVLARCILADLCLDKKNRMGHVATAILTASACETRTLSVGIDLVGMAEDRIRFDGSDVRQRSEMLSLKEVLSLNKFDEIFAPLEESADLANAIEILKKLGKISKIQMQFIGEANNKISSLQNLLKIQDEELQMLWWMVSKYSWKWDCAFCDINQDAFPILIGKEAANLTEVFSEAPSLKSVLSRLGIGGRKNLTIPGSINACSIDQLKVMETDYVVCSTIFPLHFAFSRAVEVDGTKSWITTWSKAAGIRKTAQVSPLELALQTHRESKLISNYI